MPKTERTPQGLQYIMPGCERMTAPRAAHSQDSRGQLLMAFYAEPTTQERLDAMAKAPLRSRRGQRPPPRDGLFG